MTFLFTALVLFALGGILALVNGKNYAACKVASAFASIGCLLGFTAALAMLVQGETASATLPVNLPIGQISFKLDPLACFFLLPVFFIGFFSSLILPQRMMRHQRPVHFGRQSFFFCFFLLGMCLVITAAEGFFFLLSWECMSLAPFFLLAPEDKNQAQRYSSWLYLIVAHLGAIPLILLFASMMQEAGSGHFVDFATFANWQNVNLLFILAIIGFGMKMGLAPLHIWMPEAHSLAPVDVTILLSGTMVNIGLYGILRVLGMLGVPAMWWAYALMLLGAISGILGIVLALAQGNLKRSLAFSSSDNMGIVALGIGSAILAALNGFSLAATFLFAGALLHVWNHSIFKALLFLSGASVVDATGTTSISHLGGLQKKMPVAGTSMAIGAAAISGLPPLNGFMGEMLLYTGFALAATAGIGTVQPLIFWFGLFILATIAGLSLLCFSRLYALIFLGAPRSESYQAARATSGAWKFAMQTMAVCCLLASLTSPLLFSLIKKVITQLWASIGFKADLTTANLNAASLTLIYVTMACAGFIIFATAVVYTYKKMQRKRGSAAGPTWDCGYALPSARMQYTAGSFTQFPSKVLRPFLRAKTNTPFIEDYFPTQRAHSFQAPDWILNLWNKVMLSTVVAFGEKTKVIQHGRLNAYVLYILLALITTLAFALGDF